MLHVAQRACLLRVGVIGINHKTADLSLREAIARGAESFSGERSLFSGYPTVVLSTCNRTELYFASDDPAQAHSALLAILRKQIAEPFEQRLYSYFGIDCFAHLCAVASGLDSAILGETEIQRQVKVAYARACSLIQLPSALHYIFQKSLKVGKEVRSELEMERGAPTLFGMIWQIASEKWNSPKGKKILLVGNSEINRGFAAFLMHKGIEQFTLCTRDPSSLRLEGVRVGCRKLLAEWASYDWIVCASKAEDYLIRGKGAKEHLIFDLSVPRNVDPEVDLASSSALWNIEQVNQRIEGRRKAERDCLEKSHALVWHHVLRLARIYRQKSERADSILLNKFF